jgi:hypothetical protein
MAETMHLPTTESLKEGLEATFTPEQLDRLLDFMGTDVPGQLEEIGVSAEQAKMFFYAMMESFTSMLLEEQNSDGEVKFDLMLFGVGMMALGSQVREIIHG